MLLFYKSRRWRAIVWTLRTLYHGLEFESETQEQDGWSYPNSQTFPLKSNMGNKELPPLGGNLLR